MNLVLLRKWMLLFVVLMAVGRVVHASDPKPRVIVMTDGEVDDRSSMVRFLLYTCDVEVCAIIQTNSIFQREGHSREGWYEKQLEAYATIYPNLIKHNPDYPTVDKLREISFIGDEDHDHLRGLINKRWELIPGAEITFKPDDWKDTPGSEKIVQVLLEKNPDPVHIQAWGGGNTAARAFYKLKTEYPGDYQRAVSKVVMYNIWYQDGAGNYIERNHPEVTMIYCGSFAGTWNYRSQPGTTDFITQHVKNDHGPLGALYPQTYVSEGDSPAFFYVMNNGLVNYLNPGYGGWGGRFTKVPGMENVYADAEEDGDVKLSLRRWIDEVNNDFQARMDWCVASREEANHPPLVTSIGSFRAVTPSRTTYSGRSKPGGNFTLRVSASDPDGDDLEFRWWQYREAGSYDGEVLIDNPSSDRVRVSVPADQEQGSVHIIVEVRDNGSPALVSYLRYIIDIN